MKKLISLLFIVVMFVAVALRGVAIESQYKNNLLNVELTQMPDNRVSVLLVFEKPYTDAIKVVYKTDNEYNILLPETYHSMTSVSAINALNVRSANVKLVPYFNQDNANGYTKITIKTTRPVVFNAHASYLTTKLAQNDELIEKLSKDDDFKITPTTLPVQSKATKPTTKKATPVKKEAAKKQPVAKAKAVAPKTKKATPVKPAVKPVTTTKPATPVTATPKPVEVKPVEQTQPITQTQEQTVPPAIVEPIPQENVQTTPAPAPETSTSIINRLTEFANSQYGFATLMGLSVFILLLLLMRKRKPKQQTQQTYQQPVHYEASTQDDLKDMENLSWQEKYKAMKQREEQAHTAQESAYKQEQAEEIQEIYAPEEPTSEINDYYTSEPNTEYYEEEPIQQYSNVDLDELDNYREPETPINLYKEDISSNKPVMTIENLDDLSDISPEIEGLVSPEHLYEQEPADIEISEPTQHEYSEQPILLNQTKISKTKGFYLIRYETEVALVGYIKDKIFLLQTFTNTKEPIVQTRLTEKKQGEDIYLVRADNYKALVGVSKDRMKTLIKL